MLSDASFHHIPHIFDGVKIRAMRWPGKVLEVTLVLSKPILSTSGSMYRCIIVHKVSVAIRIKMQHCRGIVDLPVYLGIAWLFVCARRTPEHHFRASRICPISWYSLQTLVQCESDKMDSWPSGVHARFDVFHQCKIRYSVIHPTTLPASNPQMSSVFFPDIRAKEFLLEG